MVDVRIYTTTYCPFCHRARGLLEDRGIPFEEIDVTGDTRERDRLTAETGRATVPQVFIRGDAIGGYDELLELDRSGRLERLLSG